MPGEPRQAKMNRNTVLIAALSVLFLVAGCACKEHLQGRLSMLENEVADLHQANQKINRRIDDLQIQLSVINKKLSSRDRSKTSEQPPLKVVKLHPLKTVKKKQLELKLSHKKGSMPEIDPRKVSERLPVDPKAARRSLWGVDANQ
jgi:peptidoglycan hydrolase CwlO-like protein